MIFSARTGLALAGVGPVHDLGAEPLWAVVLWRHVQSTVLYDHGRAQIQSFTTRIEHVC